MKKKIFAFAFCMITIMYMFTGCSLFVENQERKLNQVVASVGNVEVTLDELLRNYANNAQSLVQQGYTAEQAVEYCLTSVLIREVIADIGREMETDKKITISDKDKSSTISDLVTYFGSFMDAYAEEVRKDMGYDTTVPDEEDDAEGFTKEEKFEPAYNYGVQVVQNGEDKSYKMVFDSIENDDVEFIQTYADVYKSYEQGKDITDSLFKILDDSYVAEFGDEMKDRIYEEISIAYKTSYTFYSKYSEKQIIVKEMTKMLDEYINQLYIDKVTEYYTEIAEEGVNATKIVNSYLEKYNASKALYENNMDAYVKAMLEDSSKVYYSPDENAFGYVTHVLLQYSDKQKKDLEEMKKVLSKEEYELYEKKVADKIKVNAYDENGNVIRENVPAGEVFEEIKNAVLSADTLEERAKIFNKYVYMYNMDPGIKNAERDYVVGREIKEDSETDSRSKMVESFTDATRSLLEAYIFAQDYSGSNLIGDLKDSAVIMDKPEDAVEDGKVYYEDIKDGEYVGYTDAYNEYIDNAIFVGEEGAMSGLVLTEHGYHIIMFTGTPKNIDLTSSENVELAKKIIVNEIKEQDKTSTITVDNVASMFTNVELQAMILKCYTTNAHTKETYLDETLTSVVSTISLNYSSALYSEYISKYQNTNKAYKINKGPYKYLYQG